jgi:hypothetical protein
MKVFLLWHTHPRRGGEDDEKLLGVYSSTELAETARARATKLPGFCDSPEGFEICPYDLDKDEWQEGYVTVPA